MKFPTKCRVCGGRMERTRSDLFEKRWICVKCGWGYSYNATPKNTVDLRLR